MSIYVNSTAFDGAFRPIYISDSSKVVRIDNSFFIGSYSTAEGGGAYLNAKDVYLSRLCGLSTSSIKDGGFVYSTSAQTGNNNITLCSIKNCKSTQGTQIYHNTGNINLEDVNITKGEGIHGAYAEESSSVKAVAGFCIINNVISLQYYIFGLEQNFASPKVENYAHHISFDNCTCKTPGAFPLATSFSETSNFEMFCFTYNNVAAGYLVGANSGSVKLSRSYFGSGNQCKGFLGSGVTETDNLDTKPDIHISTAVCYGQARCAEETTPWNFLPILINSLS